MSSILGIWDLRGHWKYPKNTQRTLKKRELDIRKMKVRSEVEGTDFDLGDLSFV